MNAERPRVGPIVVAGIVALLLFDAAGALASQRLGFSHALLVPGALLLYAIVAALVARRREWLLGFLAAMVLAFVDVTLGSLVSALIGPGRPAGELTLGAILGGAMTAFVLAGLAGGIGAAIGARMAKRSMVLAILGLSFGHLEAQSTAGPAASILGTWEGTSLCADRAHDPACRDEHVIYQIDSAAGPNGPVRMVADKIVNGARVNMGIDRLQYDTLAHVWFMDIQTRFHARWSFAPKGAEMSGTLVELPAGRVVRHVTVRRSS